MSLRARLPILLVAVVAAGALLVPVPIATRAGRAWMDLAHAPLFAGLYALAWRLSGHEAKRPIGAAIALWLAVIGFGLALEGAQALTGRSASWSDAAANALGATAGLALVAGWTAGVWHKRLAGLLAALALLWFASLRGLAVIADEHAWRAAMPTLATFDDAGEVKRWFSNRARIERVDDPTRGDCLKVELFPGKYPSIGAAPPRDWNGYQALSFRVFVEGGAPLDLTVKVCDAEHNDEFDDRFERVIQFPPGMTVSDIPLEEIASSPTGRRMDLSRVALLQFFAHNLKTPRTFLLDDVRLVPGR